MSLIRDFQKLRQDRKIIDESMTACQIAKFDWQPSKVVSIRWMSDGQAVEMQSPFGVLAIVVPGRAYVAAIAELDETGSHSKLDILNSDGSFRRAISNSQQIDGHKRAGMFCRFEPAQSAMPDCFGVIFRVAEEHSDYKLDINASDGTIVNCVLST